MLEIKVVSHNQGTGPAAALAVNCDQEELFQQMEMQSPCCYGDAAKGRKRSLPQGCALPTGAKGQAVSPQALLWPMKWSSGSPEHQELLAPREPSPCLPPCYL